MNSTGFRRKAINKMAAVADFKVCFDSGISAAYLVKWKVKPGSKISQGSILLLYDEKKPCGENGNASNLKKMKATTVGTVLKLLKTEGDAIHQGCAVLIMKGCSHPVVMKDMCAECGADLREYGIQQEQKSQKASVAMIHSIPELVVSQEQAQVLGKADESRLLKHKKLVLLVDLDQTLIHTTNDDIPANLKDVHHFQLYGSYSPWYHARLRPGTKEFLEKISKIFELHICTFGARTYAHTIAHFLDKDGRYFSHRILSRDECFDPNSKTANLSALFPCGDHLVCIIDDREDVWNYAPNLVHVKPYHFFQHTGDINAPPGLSKSENDSEDEGKFFIGRKVTRIKKRIQGATKTVDDKKTADSVKVTSNSNLMESNEPERVELPVPEDLTVKTVGEPKELPVPEDLTVKIVGELKELPVPEDLTVKTVSEPKELPIPEDLMVKAVSELKGSTEVSQDIIAKAGVEEKCCAEGVAGPVADNAVTDVPQNVTAIETPQPVVMAELPEDVSNADVKSDTVTSAPSSVTENGIVNEDSKSKKLAKVFDTKDAKPNESEQEENLLDVEDDDDYLLYLSEILENIHKAFYKNYAENSSEIPDLKKVIPQVRQKVLRGVMLVFSGIIPTNVPAGKSRAYRVAKSLGAEIQQNIVLRAKDNKHKVTTHVVAARLGTIKVNEAKRSRGIHVVTPDWLWCCASRWERVSESLFPLTKETAIDQKNAILEAARSLEHAAVFEMVPSQVQQKIEVFPTYDPVTGKRINKVKPIVSEPESSDNKSQNATCSSEPAPKFADSFNPLMSFSSEEIASMDQEVEDLLDSPDTDEEDSIEETTKKLVLKQTTNKVVEDDVSSSSSSNEAPHGWRKVLKKRKLNCIDEEDVANDDTETDNDGEYERPKYPRCELPIDSAKSDSEGDSDEFNNSVGSVDEEMAAAVEREFLGM